MGTIVFTLHSRQFFCVGPLTDIEAEVEPDASDEIGDDHGYDYKPEYFEDVQHHILCHDTLVSRTVAHQSRN